MAERKRVARSSELLLPPQGAGVAFVGRELSGNGRTSRGPPKTFRVEKSSALGRVRMLLPQLAAAESQLQEMVDSGSPSAVDIENISEDEPHISMDLALIPLAEEESGLTSGDSTSSSSESDDDEENIVGRPSLKIPGQRNRTAGIEELPCH